MHALRRRLPSLNHLFAAEAVGRLLSFTDAADELGISQPAVSKSIRTIEEGLGFQLFERDRRGLRPTVKGKIFCSEAQSFLNQLLGTVRDLSGNVDEPVVRACFSSSFVALWLLPRLPDFNRQFPEIALHLEESDSDRVCLDDSDLDFSARLGDGKWEDVRSWFLTSERVGAVAAPHFVERNSGLEDLQVLAGSSLIHVDEPKRVRIGWVEWFSRLNAGPTVAKPAITVSDYHSAIDAALMAQGVALGWDHLVKGKVEQGQLVWVGPHRVETGQAIYLVESLKGRSGRHISSFRDWMIQQFP